MSPHDWLADRPGIAVMRADLRNGDMGRWYPGISTIVLADDLTAAEERDTLAHEIAHILRDDPHGDPEEEEKADQLAELIFGPYTAY